MMSPNHTDYVEQAVYDQFPTAQLQQGDILLSSTGDGTLGKACAYRLDKPAIADGHVTVIRVSQEDVYPEYLCDYLRLGFGAQQIVRLYTGSTGLIELTPAHVNRIVVDLLGGNTTRQMEKSHQLRTAESVYQLRIQQAEQELNEHREEFAGLANTMPS